MQTMSDLFNGATIAEMQAAGRPLISVTVGYLSDLWSQGCYKFGELQATSGAILNISPLADGLVTVEFENGILTVSRSSTIKVFD